MNVDIGQITLTTNQKLNWQPSALWLSLHDYSGDIVMQASSQPTQADIDALKAQLAALPDVTPQSVYIAQFDWNAFWGQVFYELSPQATYALCGFEQPIQSLWAYPNIAGIRPFLQGLVGQTYNNYTITQADLDIVLGAFTAQNIILP